MSIKKSQAKCTENIGLSVIQCFSLRARTRERGPRKAPRSRVLARLALLAQRARRLLVFSRETPSATKSEEKLMFSQAKVAKICSKLNKGFE